MVEVNRSPNQGMAAALTLRELARRQDDGAPRDEPVLFDRHGVSGHLERRAVLTHVFESTYGRERSAGPLVARFLFVVPRESVVDLRRATRAALAELERSAGTLPPWIAAEHGTKFNRHVHVVLALVHGYVRGSRSSLRIGRAEIVLLRDAFNRDAAQQRHGWRPSWCVLTVQHCDQPDVLESPDLRRPFEARARLSVTQEELEADLRQARSPARNTGLELAL